MSDFNLTRAERVACDRLRTEATRYTSALQALENQFQEILKELLERVCAPPGSNIALNFDKGVATIDMVPDEAEICPIRPKSELDDQLGANLEPED